MIEYHKIHTVWKRDMKGNIVIGDFARPEFEYLKDASWTFTEKVDGTNIRIGWDGKAVQFGGRTDNASIPAPLVNHLRETFTDEKMRAKFGEDAACLYGEGFGAKIQKGGGNYGPTQSFVLFDVTCGRWWLKRDGVEDVAACLGIGVVPIVLTGTLLDGQDLVIGGIESAWGKFQAEGLVGFPAVGLLDRGGERIVVKMKTRDYGAALRSEVEGTSVSVASEGREHL